MTIYPESSTAQHSTAQHSTAQHSTARHSTAQHSTAQHSTAQHTHPNGALQPAAWPACKGRPLESWRLPHKGSSPGRRPPSKATCCHPVSVAELLPEQRLLLSLCTLVLCCLLHIYTQSFGSCMLTEMPRKAGNTRQPCMHITHHKLDSVKTMHIVYA